MPGDRKCRNCGAYPSVYRTVETCGACSASQVATLTRERDEARKEVERLEADAARLRGALESLSRTEEHYRKMHDRHGGRHLVTGHAWDMLRKAGIEARAALAEQAPDATPAAVGAGCTSADIPGVREFASFEIRESTCGVCKEALPLHHASVMARVHVGGCESRLYAALAGEGEVVDPVAAERERCARIAEAHPLHPSTHTGERQRWLRAGIAEAIRKPEKARQA